MSNLGLTFVYEGELLHSAAVYDQSDFLVQLLDAGTSGDVNSRNDQGLTPLHTAAQHGSTQCVQLLLERGADPNAISGLEDGLQTPLHYAARNGHLGCLMVMLEYEVDLTLTDKCGLTAKDVAIEESHIHCRNFLIESEARKHQEYEEAKRNDLYDFVVNWQVKEAEETLLSMEDPDVAINRYYRGANTLLCKASHAGDLKMAEMLLRHGADGRTNADNGISPLYAAAHLGHVEVIGLLLEKLPNLLNVKMSIDNTTPLHSAAMQGKTDAMAVLLRHRLDPSLPTDNADKGNNRSGLSLYVDVNAQDDSGITPLHYAVRSGNLNTVRELLNCKPILKGAVENPHPGQLAIDLPMVDGKTALHDAVLMDKVAVAELLLQNGSNVNAVLPTDNSTLLQIACERSSVDMVCVLLEYGAKDFDDKARLHAEKLERFVIVQLLLNSSVYTDTENSVCCTVNAGFHPVSIAWHSKQLSKIDIGQIKEAVFARHPVFMRGDALKSECLSLITKVNLSKNKLSVVPKELFMMVSLKSLNLSDNCITEIPDTVAEPNDTNERNFEPNCCCLEELDLSSNKLTSLPRWVFHLPSLMTLNSSKNSINTLPYDMWIGISLKTLLLRKNNISELPVVEEDYVTALAASKRSHSNSRSETPNSQKKPDVKREFSVGTSSISIMSCRPSWEADSDDSDDDEEEQATKKSGLDRLDLSSNHLTSVPLGLACLAPNLSRLVLTSNKITDVSSISLFPASIVMICLSRNTLTRFDLSGRYFVTDRQCYIVLGANHSRTMSYPQCMPSKSPEKLCRHRNHRTLMHLRQLNLSFNCLSDLPLASYQGARHAGNVESLFPGLQTLDISNNAFRDVPLHIGQLAKLGSLSLSGNVQIDRLPPELGLCSDLYELRIQKLRLSLKSILHRDTGQDKVNAREVTSHLKSLYENSQPYRRIKLMFVGVSNIGKTSLLHALRKDGTGTYQSAVHQNDFVQRQKGTGSGSGGGKEKLSTVGVDVCDWTYQKRSFMSAPLGPEVTFGTWDFGGQKEYYATHQCFLSHRALYLLLWKMTEKKKGIDDMEGWLLNIQARAPDSPVIIVGTHIDGLPGNEKRQREAADSFRRTILSQYVHKDLGGGVNYPAAKGLPRVLQVTEVSCGETEFQIKELRNLIYDTALSLEDSSNNPVMESQVPAIYVHVETAVKRMKAKRIKDRDMPVINEVTFKEMLVAELQSDGVRLRNVEEFEASIRFLHDNGLLLHYDDPSLRDLYFVDPQWLCDMLAHIISVRDVNPRISGGLMKVSDLSDQIFRSRRFPTSFVNKYIDLMSKFEVAIKVTNRYLLVPSLLPEKQKNCPKLSKDLFPVLRSAMDLSAYLDHRVFRRQYLMSYVPSGFWARLITRLIADDRICSIVSSCCTVVNHDSRNNATDSADDEALTKIVPPEWACWRTGIELAYFGVKLLRVCQLPRKTAFYGAKGEECSTLFVRDTVQNVTDTVTVEVIAPSVSLTIERFIPEQSNQESTDAKKQEHAKTPPRIAHRVLGTDDTQCHTACKFLALVVEHVDNLLSDWYYVLDLHINMQGSRGVQRLSLCHDCLNDVITMEQGATGDSKVKEEPNPGTSQQTDPPKGDATVPPPRKQKNTSQGISDEIDDAMLPVVAKNCIVAFPFEEGVKRIDISEPMVCPKHDELNFERLFPDIMFEDFANNLMILPASLQRGKFLAVGGYGAVFKGTLRQSEGHVVDVAIKIPMNTDTDGTENPEAIQNAINNRRLREGALTTTTNNAYRSIRQELSILVPVKHNHIVSMLGVAMSPLSLVIEFAPSGALNNVLGEIKRASKKMDPYVLQKCIQQVASALQYLHKRNIIYRDLKSENVLVWSFPEPNVPRPDIYPVLLKLTDYGISRSVAISGTRGMLGTHGFMAPEIIKYRGRESYTMKVDSFSFGMFMYEMIALMQPFAGILGSKASLADQLVLEGKRPRLTATEKTFPIPVLSLMYRCWSQKPDDRPSAADIVNVSKLLEFPRLIDAFKLGEKFSVQCLVSATEAVASTAMVADSRDLVGSSVWLCGHEDAEEPSLQSSSGLINVLSYKDRKCCLLNETRTLDRVLLVCAVGSTVWIGTLLGAIQVYCAVTFKALALGRLINHRSLLAMLHSPVCHAVFVTLADGSLYKYEETLSSYVHTIASDETGSYFPSGISGTVDIKELIPSKIFPGDLMHNRIHCLAVVPSYANDHTMEEPLIFFGADGKPVATTTRGSESSFEEKIDDDDTSAVRYELWCGQEHGVISVLDAMTLRKVRTLPVRDTDLSDPILNKLLVRFMETHRQFCAGDYSDNGTTVPAASMWIVVYPGTEVCRWDVNSRRIMGGFDACLHGPQNELAQARSSKKAKAIDASKAQISALIVVEGVMYVGTSYGCLVICNAESLVVRRVIRCFEHPLDGLVPLRAVPSRRSGSHVMQKLIVCSGRGLLWRGLQRSSKTTDQQGLLTFLADHWS